jgi:uncharacterized membrane protein
MIGISQPIWLLLALPAAAALWQWRLPTRLLTIMRGIGLALVLAAVAGLSVRLPSRAATLVVVVDRSQSMPGDDAAIAEARDIIEQLEDAKGTNDRLAVLSFGRSSVIERAPGGQFTGFNAGVGVDASNYHAALERALSLIDPESPGRIIVVGDGRWTGADPIALAARAAARRVSIDYSLLQRPTTHDVAIASIEAPGPIAPGEGFVVTAWVTSPIQQEVTYELVRGNQVLALGSRRLDAGLNRLLFRDRAEQPGVQQYRLRIATRDNDADDPVRENNTARLLVGVKGQKPVLHLAPSEGSQLARLLREAKVDVELAGTNAPRDWSIESLANYSAVLIENVTWQRLGETGMANVADWVRQTGAGVMMTGGQLSYGPGGYHKSPIEDVLPVSMELRREHRKLALALVIAMDRSGSMGAPVSGALTKMDLANQGAIEVVDMLTAMDEIGVWAVDSQAHKIVELQNVENKSRIKDKISRIASQGGGIFAYEALSHAVGMIQAATAGTKHIVLFADAADTEQPGDYIKLVDAAAAAGITFSVIGLGEPTDPDADLLRDIARRGNGRALFTTDPQHLPRLFAQDAFVVARKTFLDEPTDVQLTGGLTTLTGDTLSPARQSIGGYNLTYLKPRANLAAVTIDEHEAPLIASWRTGAGRAVAYTGEADGKYTGPIARWQQMGTMLTSLVRWAAGEDRQLPGGAMLTQEAGDGLVTVTLHLDPQRTGESFEATPRVKVLRGLPGQAPTTDAERTMQWADADTLTMQFELRGEETAIAAVQIGPDTIAMPPVTLAYSPEFAPAGRGRGEAALAALAAATGGSARSTMADLWQQMPRRPRLVELSPWLMFAAVFVFLLEVFERRSGMLSIIRRRDMRRRQRRIEQEERAAETAPAQEPVKGAKRQARSKQKRKAAKAEGKEEAPAREPSVLRCAR